MTLRSTIVSLFAGFAFAVGWWILIDGVVYGGHVKGNPKFEWYYFLPAIFAMVCQILLNLVKPSQLTEDEVANKARIWVFFFMAATFMCLGGAIWVTAQHYGDKVPTPYPGIALIVQTLLMLFSGLLFFAGRGTKSESYF